MRRNKVSVIGAGAVGANVARRIAEKDLADVVLLDIAEGLAEGKALDVSESAPLEGFSSTIVGTTDYVLTERSDIVIVTAGLARKPGMSRDDLLSANAEIVKGIVERVSRSSPEAVLVMVTNPLDVMSYLAYKTSGFPKERVLGMAGVLDSARYRYFIAEALSVSPRDVQALVLGGHGDLMVPLSSLAVVAGIPVRDLLPEKKINEIEQRTKSGGGEIVKLLKSGSAYYAPSSAVVAMVEGMLSGGRSILPCSVLLDGEYGLSDVYCGVPVRLTLGGVKEIIELELDDPDKKALHISAGSIKKELAKIGM